MSDSNTMRIAGQCPECGSALPKNALDGLCPRCLLRKAAEPTASDLAAACKSRAAAPDLNRVAGAFPHLEILELVGQGGMGCVFKARQPQLNRLVALKILPEDLARDPAFAKRFTREAQALAALNHPNIVTVHDFGQSGGFFYLLMEFVDGVNLRQALEGGRFTPQQALAIVPPICEALQFAHDHGIVHRDIKPENLLLDRTGRVKIADFGIAKMIGATPLAGEEKPAGTPSYIAPEQALSPAEADHRADIYSLGVVLYEMLTGELPAQRLEPPSRKIQMDVRLDEVVLRALEKSPALRWQTVAEMQTQLETIAAAQNPSAPVLNGKRREIFDVLLLCFPPALFAWFVLVGRERMNVDIDSDVLLWTSLIGFPLAAVVGALFAWAFGGFTEIDRQLVATKRRSWLAIVGAMLVAVSIQLLGGGMAMVSLLQEERGHWNSSGGELLFTLLFAGGGIVMALAGTVVGFAARQQIRRTPGIGWGAASNAAWFWPGLVVIFAALAAPALLIRNAPERAAQVAQGVVPPGPTLDLLPPVVVETYPPSGTTNVPPGITELRARFSKPMRDANWSWSSAWQESMPKTVSGARYLDQYTCAITVDLEPNRTYAYWLNSEHFSNFKDQGGRPAVPYLLIFRTGPPTDPRTTGTERNAP